MSVDTFVISKMLSVVVVWLASDCLIALRCSLFRSISVEDRGDPRRVTQLGPRNSSSTIVVALTVTPVQVRCLVLTAWQVQLHHQQ